MHVALEAIIVGVVLAAAMLIASRFAKLSTPARIAAVSFAVGALFHLVCEVSGVNKAYCASKSR